MTINQPKLSIVCPSYNHGDYVSDFINSVLNQTEQDFELIIVDDASTDHNVQEIRHFNDHRITLIQHSFNQGINATLGHAIEHAKADIIGMSASDDMLEPTYIEAVLQAFSNPEIGVVYVPIQYMAANNELLDIMIKLPKNETRFQILERSFDDHNPLPSPGMAVRKDHIRQLLPFPAGMFQYQDWKINNQLLLKHEVEFLHVPLLRYRRLATGVDSISDAAVLRKQLETTPLMNTFLEIKDVNLLTQIFGSRLDIYGCPTSDTIPYFLSRLALESPDQNKQYWGYQTLLTFLSEPDQLTRLHELYGFTFKDFIGLVPLPVPPPLPRTSLWEWVRNCFSK